MAGVQSQSQYRPQRRGLFEVGPNKANFFKAGLRGANLSEAYLINVDFSRANLRCTDLRMADLRGANLNNVTLQLADLSFSNLTYADLTNAACGMTIFAGTLPSNARGLDTIKHEMSSPMSIDTILKAEGKIPEIFLRGCGVPETVITFLPSMLEQAIQFYSCFISYSHTDRHFARLLHDRLQGAGVRCWLDEHELNPGDKLHPTIYEAIRVYDKVILCCSKTSLTSWWVEKEFENAVAKEEAYKETVLIPLDLDGYLFGRSKDSCVKGEIKKRYALSFVGWNDLKVFEAAFPQVVKALRIDGGKPPPPEPKMRRRRR